MSLQHFIIHSIIKQFLCCILIIILQQRVTVQGHLTGNVSSPVGESPYSWISIAELSDKDKRHPASNNLQFFQLFWFDQMSSLLLLPISILTRIIFALL